MSFTGNNFRDRRRRGDGYSATRFKRNGGMFRYEASVSFDYTNFDGGMVQARKSFANMAKELNSNKNIVFNKGVSSQVFEVPEQMRKSVKWRVNNIGKNTSSVMKSAMLDKIGGRIETGTMKSSIYGRTERPYATLVVSRAGWLDLFYKYFGFQEEGTSTGIKPMRAIQKGTIVGRNYAARELSKMARELRRGKKGPM